MTPSRAPRIELASAAGFDADALAALFTAGYEGYWFPIRLDGPAFTAMADIVDADLGLSRVAIVDGEPAAIVLVARRGTEAWIGGMGVVVSQRRRGIGRTALVAALDAAREAGVERVTLEVLEQNDAARRLYEQLGFERTRDLEVWSLPGAPGEAAEVPASEARAWLRARRTEREPWQRDDASLDGLSGLRGLMVDGAAAVVRTAGDRVVVLQLGGEPAALRKLLAGARSLGETLSLVNLPAHAPAAGVLEELGGRVDARQHEMELRL